MVHLFAHDFVQKVKSKFTYVNVSTVRYYYWQENGKVLSWAGKLKKLSHARVYLMSELFLLEKSFKKISFFNFMSDIYCEISI